MTASPGRHRTLDGILLMVTAFGIVPLMDGAAKMLARGYDPLQIVWGRYLFQSIFMSVLVFGIGRKPIAILRTHRPGLQTVRAFFGWSSNLPFITALIFIPLADAVSIVLVGPLLVTALSVPLLGERVGIWRWSAVVAGMAGALIIVRPGMGVMHWAIILPLVSATTFGLYQIFTRRLSGTENVDSLLLLDSYAGLLFSMVALPFVWKTPDLEGWGLMILMGVIVTGTRVALVYAFKFAAASILAPFAYIQIVSAAIIGLVVFGDFPDRWTILGAAIVCLSGIFIALRERARA
ncbi:MAG: DMT family transporter [Alphaproteobacteria bacterium]